MKRLALLVALGVALGIGAGAVALALRPAAAETRFRGSQPPPGIELPAFSLRDHEGRAVSAADLAGKAVALTFLETQCRQACPVIAEHVRLAFARLPAAERERVAAVAVSTHPGDDTPDSVAAFIRRHRVEGTLRYLIGSEDDLRPVWKAFAVLPSLDTGDPNVHSAPVRVYDPRGVWVSTLHAGADLTPANLAADLVTALGRADG